MLRFELSEQSVRLPLTGNLSTARLPTDSPGVAERLCYCIHGALLGGHLLRHLRVGRAAGLGQP